MRLVDCAGRTVIVGSQISSAVLDRLPLNLAEVITIFPPHKTDSGGKVRVRWISSGSHLEGSVGVYYVGVFDLKFVED